MKSIAAALIIFCTVLVAFPVGGFAQISEGTFGDCVDLISDAETVWDSGVTTTGPTDCFVTKGAANARLYGEEGTGPGAIPWRMDVYLFKDGRVKRCAVLVRSYPSGISTTEFYGQYYVAGKNASLWNKYVKGDGCQRLMDKED